MTNQSQQPDRGTPAPPAPGSGPTPPGGHTPLQDHAPPEDASSAELLGEDEQSQGSGGTGGAGGQGGPEKDVEDWATGDEPMTGPQRSYLQTLAREAGEDVPQDLTKAQASQLIDRLQARTGRGS